MKDPAALQRDLCALWDFYFLKLSFRETERLNTR